MDKKISPYQHIIYSHQFGVDFLKELFDLTDKIKKNPLAFKGHSSSSRGFVK